MGWKKKDTEEAAFIEPQIEAPRKVLTKEMVVVELPQTPTRRMSGENGEVYKLTTLTEAVQEILENTREILRIAKE